jgi:hypothetical protein
VTKTLVGTLGYINREKREVGIDFARDGGPIAEFICGNLVVVVEGSVIGKISPVNKLLKPPSHFVLQFVQKGGKQRVTKLEGGPPDVLQTSLNGGPFEQSGLSSTDLIMFVAPVEIKA